MPCASSLFYHLEEQRVIVCRECRYAVWPDQVSAHLRLKHEAPRKEVRAIATEVASWGLQRSPEDFRLVRTGLQPLDHLPVYQDGVACQLRPAQCQYVCRSLTSLRNHWRTAHRWRPSPLQRRGGSMLPAEREEYQRRCASASRPVHCQRLFLSGTYASYYEVVPDRPGPSEATAPEAEADTNREPPSLADLVRGELATLEQAQSANDQVFRGFESKKEVSPWLELTRWPEYLRGHRPRDIAQLIAPPSAENEAVLLAVCDSLERVVKEAHQSVCDDKVNVFDQARINSFLQRPRAADRPLMVKLQRSTWRTYTRIWKSLLCFVYRTSRPDHRKSYRHQLTSRQAVGLAAVITRSNELALLSPRSDSDGASVPRDRAAAVAALDQSCLDFCISLLDHDLKGDLFESAILGFFVAAGVDSAKEVTVRHVDQATTKDTEAITKDTEATTVVDTTRLKDVPIKAAIPPKA